MSAEDGRSCCALFAQLPLLTGTSKSTFRPSCLGSGPDAYQHTSPPVAHADLTASEKPCASPSVQRWSGSGTDTASTWKTRRGGLTARCRHGHTGPKTRETAIRDLDFFDERIGMRTTRASRKTKGRRGKRKGGLVAVCRTEALVSRTMSRAAIAVLSCQCRLRADAGSLYYVHLGLPGLYGAPVAGG
jgi:hypothetical protein